MGSEDKCESCIFCGSSELTEEHLVADWAVRAFLRSRRTDGTFSGTFVAPETMRIDASPPPSTARVVCRSCNNEWLSVIDSEAAQVLKPLIRGDAEVSLDKTAQASVAAWIFKCALTFDAAGNGENGPLKSLRAQFCSSRKAPPGCVIYAGPATPVPWTVPGIPEVAGVRMFGVRPANGIANVTLDMKTPEGKPAGTSTFSVPIPGYQVMLGALYAYLGGRVPPVAPNSLTEFSQIWPAREQPVVVRCDRRGLKNAA